MSGKTTTFSFRSIITYVLAFQMTAMPELALSAQNKTQTPPAVSNSTSTSKQNSLSQWIQRLKQQDPIWEEFMTVAPQSEGLSLQFDMKDPAIDRDPFFLRAQSWIPVPSKNPSLDLSQDNEVSFQSTTKGAQILFPNVDKALQLHVPLTPFASTDEFLFFSLDATSPLFQKASGLGEKPGEGLFFISRKDVVEKAPLQQSVPIHFFPLPGTGWTGPLVSQELTNLDTLAVANKEGTAIAIDLKDVETVMTAQKINLLLATALTLKNSPSVTTQTVYPAPGTTAAFGLFFTGTTQGLNASNLERATEWVLNQLQHFPLLALALQSQKAKALDVSADFIPRLIYVSSILTGMLALSVVLKYAHPGIRAKLKNSYSKEATPTSLAAKAGREVRQVFDVFAHITTTSAQFVPVTVGNSIDIFIDRFMPSAGAAEHTFVRRFMNNTFFFAREAVKRSPVNAKTFALGALLMGGIDTAFVALQYFVVVPWMCQSVSEYVSAYWKNKINETFDPVESSNVNGVAQSSATVIATTDTIRNGLSYLQNGASSYSIDSRTQVIELVTEQVESEMRKSGKDPKKASHQNLRERLIEKKTSELLQQRGLPDSKNLLFDADSLFSLIPKSLGYQASSTHEHHDSFILAKRFGLSKAALDRAVERARHFATKYPNKSSLETVRLLEETAASMKTLSSLRRKGLKGFDDAKRVRKQLTLLSYEGPIEWTSHYLPDLWADASDEAIASAAVFFRQALFSFLEKEGEKLLGPSPEEMNKFEKLARENVIQKVKTENPLLSGLASSEVEKVLRNTKEMEFNVRTELEIHALARAEADQIKSDNYKPAKQSLYSQRQLNRAERRANERLGRSLGENPLTGDDAAQTIEIQRRKKQFYRDALAEEVSLTFLSPKSETFLSQEELTSYKSMMSAVETTAEANTTSEIIHETGLKKYLDSLTEYERGKIELSMYAINFLSAYQNATTQQSLVDPLSPAQPGYFQKIRQTRWVHKNNFVKRTLRTLESLVDDQTLELGLTSKLHRNVPLLGDLWASHRRLFKRLLPGMTVTYLWNYYAWQLHIPYATWAIFMATLAATIETPSMWLNRVFRMNNLKAMDNWKSKTLFAIPYGWITFLGMIPMTLFTTDVNSAFGEYVRDPFLSAMAQIDPSRWWEALALFTATGAGRAFYNQWKTRQERNRFYEKFDEQGEVKEPALQPVRVGFGLRCRQALGRFR